MKVIWKSKDVNIEEEGERVWISVRVAGITCVRYLRFFPMANFLSDFLRGRLSWETVASGRK